MSGRSERLKTEKLKSEIGKLIGVGNERARDLVTLLFLAAA